MKRSNHQLMHLLGGVSSNNIKIILTLHKFKNIAKGVTKAILKQNERLKDYRMDICNKCPLCINSAMGKRCSTDWLSPDGKTVSVIKQEGYTQGCGCFLEAKTRVPDEYCDLGKW